MLFAFKIKKKSKKKERISLSVPDGSCGAPNSSTMPPYLKQKNKTNPIFNYHLNPQESIINWNDKKFIKWGIYNKNKIETTSDIQMGDYSDSIH